LAAVDKNPGYFEPGIAAVRFRFIGRITFIDVVIGPALFIHLYVDAGVVQVKGMYVDSFAEERQHVETETERLAGQQGIAFEGRRSRSGKNRAG
jgi:hypothetical protein